MRLSILAVALASLALSGCAKSTRAGGVNQAIEITGPAGVRCFVIQDSNGAAVGGNCIPSG